MHRVPFKVVGGSFFLETNECQVLLDYIRVAVSLDQIPTRRLTDVSSTLQTNRPLLSSKGFASNASSWTCADNPSRDLLDGCFAKTVDARGDQKAGRPDLSPGGNRSKDTKRPPNTCEPLLEWIDKEIKLQQHYENYYGQGEPSLVRTQNIDALKGYARHMALSWKAFITHVDNIDTTQGRPEKSWIKMTTIHRTKGLEFDYVFIPDCQEGFLPVLTDSDDPTYDKEQPKREPKAAEWIENERRLFYVGITRACKGLYIGAPEVETAAQKKTQIHVG